MSTISGQVKVAKSSKCQVYAFKVLCVCFPVVWIGEVVQEFAAQEAFTTRLRLKYIHRMRPEKNINLKISTKTSLKIVEKKQKKKIHPQLQATFNVE